MPADRDAGTLLTTVTEIPGCHLFPLKSTADRRGWFRKLYQRSTFVAAGLDPEIAEIFLSGSSRGVVRGLHLQVPPDAHAKTVCCITGEVYDVVVDLRVGSPTHGRHAAVPLDEHNGDAVHVPVGCAHGFQALTDHAIVAYLVSSEHAAESDTGIRFDSAGIEWPLPVGEVSERDRGLPTLDAFTSPFTAP